MPEQKKFYFDFFQCETLSGQANLPRIPPDEIFRRLKSKYDNDGENTVRTLAGKTLELRRIEETDYGYRGVVGKYRKSILPHAAVPGGNERELDLREDEQLIEKAYFKYFSDNSLLILQRNRFALNSHIFGQYLSLNGYTTSLNPIIEAADLHRLIRNEVNLRALDIVIARPTNQNMFVGIEHDFNNSIIASLNSSNAAVIHLNLRGNGKSDDPEKRYLSLNLKRAIIELKNRFNLKKADVLLEEGGLAHPLDLVADRLSHSTLIEMVGKYPLASDMWAALRESREEKEQELQNYFGVLGNDRLA